MEILSYQLGLVIAIIYVNTQSEILNWNFKGIKFDKKIFYKFLKVAIPMILQEWFIGLVMLYEVKISNRTGVEGSASYGVVNKLEQVVWILGASFNSTVRIFVGQFFGDKKYEESKDIMFKGMLLELIPNIVIGTLIYVIPYQLCRIFLSNDIVIQSAIRFLRVIGIVMISTLPRSVVRGFFWRNWTHENYACGINCFWSCRYDNNVWTKFSWSRQFNCNRNWFNGIYSCRKCNLYSLLLF